MTHHEKACTVLVVVLTACGFASSCRSAPAECPPPKRDAGVTVRHLLPPLEPDP